VWRCSWWFTGRSANFGWSADGRSFDGGHLTADGDANHVTFFASRPTRGVYQVDGMGGARYKSFLRRVHPYLYCERIFRRLLSEMYASVLRSLLFGEE